MYETCDSAKGRCCNGRKSAALWQTADRSRCVRQCRGRVFNTSSKPVEPSALWDKHTDLRWPLPERSNATVVPDPANRGWTLVFNMMCVSWRGSACRDWPARALASSRRCCCRKRAVSWQACSDSLASIGQPDSRQDRASDAPSPSGFMPRLSSSRHWEGRGVWDFRWLGLDCVWNFTKKKKKKGSLADWITGNGDWFCPFNMLTAFSSPSAVIWQDEMSSTCRRGMVVVVATSSGRSSSWSRLPERRSSVRLDWSFRARRSGLREVGPKLSPQIDTEELLSWTSHSRVTRLFSSAGRQRGSVSQDKLSNCFCLKFCVFGSHPLPDFDRLSYSVQGEEEDPRNKLQPEPKNMKTSL